MRPLSENDLRIAVQPSVRLFAPLLHISCLTCFALAALGTAIAIARRTLVYGGGTKGIMGVVASAVIEGGGSVAGIVPFAISIAGGEGKGCAPGVEDALRQSSGRVETARVVALQHLYPR